MELIINIVPKKVLKILLIIISFLLVGQILYLVTHFFYGYSYRHLFLLFNFDNEGLVPTFYSTFALIFAALLLLLISIINKKHKKKDTLYWFSLSGIFFILAYDEAAQIHEGLNDYFWDSPHLPSWLGFGWVIPYSILVFILGAFLIKFLIGLPKNIAWLFMVSGIIFIAGAIGMELPGAYFWFNTGGFRSLWYNLAATIEELLEMVGIAIFIYGLLIYLKSQCGSRVQLTFLQR